VIGSVPRYFVDGGFAMLRMVWSFLAVGLLAAAARESVADEKLRDALVARETTLIDAINDKDKSAISELLADEAMSITSRGRHTTKDIIAALEEISFSDFKIIEPQAFAVGNDAAILTYTFNWTSDSSETTTVYATSVWKKTGRQWQSVFYQETAIED
jgi:hypothetical protein